MRGTELSAKNPEFLTPKEKKHACKCSGKGKYRHPAPMVLLLFLRQVLTPEKHSAAQAHTGKYGVPFAPNGRTVRLSTISWAQ